MKKFGGLCLALLMVVTMLTGCGGSVWQVERDYGSGGEYSVVEIHEAMDLVIAKFRSNFDGCALTKLAYDAEATGRDGPGWAEQYQEEEALVLTSSFEVGPFAEGSLQSNSTYNNWTWIFTRSGGGKWTLRTWGYG